MILELIDEDYYGVWEIGWRLSTALDLDPSRDPHVAADAISSLRSQGRLEIYVRDAVDDVPCPLHESGQVVDLNDASSWHVPQAGQPQLLIGATGDAD